METRPWVDVQPAVGRHDSVRAASRVVWNCRFRRTRKVAGTRGALHRLRLRRVWAYNNIVFFVNLFYSTARWQHFYPFFIVVVLSLFTFDKTSSTSSTTTPLLSHLWRRDQSKYRWHHNWPILSCFCWTSVLDNEREPVAMERQWRGRGSEART